MIIWYISCFCSVEGYESNGTLSGISIVMPEFYFLNTIHRKESGFFGETADCGLGGRKIHGEFRTLYCARKQGNPYRLMGWVKGSEIQELRSSHWPNLAHFVHLKEYDYSWLKHISIHGSIKI